MTVVGSFGPGSTYAGRTAVYDAGVFSIEGVGRIELEVLRQSEARGHFAWASPQMREWGESLAGGAPVPTPVPTQPAVGPAFVTPAATHGNTHLVTIAVVIGAVIIAGLFILGAALALGIDVSWNPGQDIGGGSGFTQSATIVVRLNTLQIPIAGTNGTGVTIQATTCDFRAESNGGNVAGPTKAFDVTDNEKSSGTIAQTAERAAAVQALVAQMQSDGWQVTGQGVDWWSVQLAR